MIAAAALVAALLAQADGAAPRCQPELFRITNNQTPSYVVYEARLGSDGKIDPEDPVRAEWVHPDGRREGLNLLERTLAYGFDVRAATAPGAYRLAMRAKPSRPIRVAEHRGCPRATLVIAQRPSVLAAIEVVAAGGGLIPRVDHVDLHGADLVSGAEVTERVVGGSQPQLGKP